MTQVMTGFRDTRSVLGCVQRQCQGSAGRGEHIDVHARRRSSSRAPSVKILQRVAGGAPTPASVWCRSMPMESLRTQFRA